MKRLYNGIFKWLFITLFISIRTIIACHSFGPSCTCGNVDSICQLCSYDQTYSNSYVQSASSYSAPGTDNAPGYAAPSLTPSETYYTQYSYPNVEVSQEGYNSQFFSPYIEEQPLSFVSSNAVRSNSPFVNDVNSLGPSYVDSNGGPLIQNEYQYQLPHTVGKPTFEQYNSNLDSLHNTFELSGLVNSETTYSPELHQTTRSSHNEDPQTQNALEPASSPFVENSGYESRALPGKASKAKNNGSITNIKYDTENRNYDKNPSRWNQAEQSAETNDNNYGSSVTGFSVSSKGNEEKILSSNQFDHNGSKTSEYFPPKNSDYYDGPTVTTGENHVKSDFHREAAAQTNAGNETSISEQTQLEKNQASPQIRVSASLKTAETGSKDNYLTETAPSDHQRTKFSKKAGDQKKEKTENCEPLMRDEDSLNRAPYVTYYHQACLGTILGEAHDETIVSATRKCALLGCDAANAVLENDGRYYVIFIKKVESRVHKPGTYCISGIAAKNFKKAIGSDSSLKLHIYSVKQDESEQPVNPPLDADMDNLVRDKPTGYSKVPRIRIHRQLAAKIRSTL